MLQSTLPEQICKKLPRGNSREGPLMKRNLKSRSDWELRSSCGRVENQTDYVCSKTLRWNTNSRQWAGILYPVTTEHCLFDERPTANNGIILKKTQMLNRKQSHTSGGVQMQDGYSRRTSKLSGRPARPKTDSHWQKVLSADWKRVDMFV